jgi:hypothetical protein
VRANYVSHALRLKFWNRTCSSPTRCFLLGLCGTRMERTGLLDNNSRFVGIDPEIRATAPHERNIRSQNPAHLIRFHAGGLGPKSGLQPVERRLIPGRQLQVAVRSECFFCGLDTILMRHMDRLRERADRKVRKRLHHLHPRGLVLPIEVVEVSTARYDDGRVRLVRFQRPSEFSEVALFVGEPGSCMSATQSPTIDLAPSATQHTGHGCSRAESFLQKSVKHKHTDRLP